MTKLLETADLAFDGEPAAVSRFTVVPPDRFSVTLSNGGKHVVAGTVELGGKKSELRLKPGESGSFTAALPAVLSSERLVFESPTAVFAQREPRPGKFTLREEFSGVLARRAAITVDGSPDDWKGVPALDVTQRIIGKSPASGFSATLRLAWSSEELFLAVEVTDDKLSVIPRRRPGEGWRNDSLQLFLDPFADGRCSGAPGLGPDDWSYGVYLEAGTMKPYVYRHRVPDIQLTEGFAGARVDTIDAETECAFRRTEHGYFYEVALPKRALMPLVLKPGVQFGLGVMLNDQDSDAAMPQSRLVWGTQAFAYNDRPDLWPLVVLAE